MALEGAKTKTLPEKSFEVREATLSKLFKNEHVNTIVQRFGLVVVFYLALSNALNDVYNGGTSEFGFKLIRIGFANPERTFALWLLMLSSHILVYFGWNVWRAFRPTKSYLWDRIWICIFLIHLFGGFHFSVFLMYELHIPIASRAIILFELPRLMMKSWAFVRTNCRESLAEAKGFEAPTLSEFVYFSFAPTLLYRKEYPRSEFGFKLIRIGFANPERTFALWLLMLSSHILVYFGWNVWRAFRPTKSYLWDRIWICAFLVHLFGGFHFFVFLMYELHIPIASRAIILFELPRLMMKSWAFVRTNCRESLAEAKGFEAPTLSEFVYFSFAPTLLYRKEYPRWPTRNWKTMGKHLLELLFIIYTFSLIEDRYLIRPLADFGKRPFTKLEIFAIIINNVVVCFVTWIIAFRAILHTTQCFFAELLRFGDRNFHKDWWNSNSLSELHIKWNVLVQDWLFHYVYKDFYEYVTPRNKFAARMAVYALSMVFHELILTHAVRIICPIYFFFMTASLLITVSKTTDAIVNKFPLFNIVLGESLLVIVPHLEYFAKENCPQPVDDGLLYVPKLYACSK